MQKYEYTHQLPYSVRSALCNLLDADQSWRSLSSKFGFGETQIGLLSQALMRPNTSPANELLNLLDSSNESLIKLSKYLAELNHWRAVELLKAYEPNHLDSAQCDDVSKNGPQTLVTPTPSFAGNKQFDSSYMELISGDPYALESPTWVLMNNNNNQNQQATLIQAQQPQTCHKDKQPVNKQDVGVANNKQNKTYHHQDAGEEKPRQAPCSSNRHRASITDQEIVNQLRLIMQINYKEIKIASDNFSESNIIGNGGFASVYRGNLKGTHVAIKRLKCNLVDQALNELTIMNSYRIDNILPIYGISIDGPEACLVYQYMSNGSLEDRLACKNNTAPLSWRQRALIGEGLAKGLYYLHTLRDKPLVHGDVKSANVLLDSQFVPKLGDFGLARQVFKGMSGKEMLTHCTVSSINGTSVYLPAEYLRHRILSPAVDVYSYGIVLLEMGTGKRAYDGKRLLIDRVEDETSAISSGQIDLTLKDHRLEDVSQEGLKIWYELMITLGLDCAHRIKKKRPDMGQVLLRYSTFWLENPSIASGEMQASCSPAPTNGSGGRSTQASSLLPTQQQQSHFLNDTLNPNCIQHQQQQLSPKLGQQHQPNYLVDFNNQIARDSPTNINLMMGQYQAQQQSAAHNNDNNINNFNNNNDNNNHIHNQVQISDSQEAQVLNRNHNINMIGAHIHQRDTDDIRNHPAGGAGGGFVDACFDPQQILFNPETIQYQPQAAMMPLMEELNNCVGLAANGLLSMQQDNGRAKRQNSSHQNRIQNQFMPFNSSMMLVEEENNATNNLANGYDPFLQQEHDATTPSYVQQTTNGMKSSTVNGAQQQQQQEHASTNGPQVEAMIPLLTELGIDGEQSN